MTILNHPSAPHFLVPADRRRVWPSETPDVFDWIQAYVQQTGYAPSLDMVRGAANFRQPGGVGRLLTALERYGLELARAKTKQEAG